MEDDQAVIKGEAADNNGGSSYIQDGLSSDESAFVQSVDGCESNSSEFGTCDSAVNRHFALDEHGLFRRTVQSCGLNQLGRTAVGTESIKMEEFNVDIKAEASGYVCDGSTYEQNELTVNAVIKDPDDVSGDVPGELSPDKCTFIEDINIDSDTPSISQSVDICENSHQEYRTADTTSSKDGGFDQHVRQCDISGNTFVQAMDLQSHVVRTHTGAKRFTCDICGKSLSRRSYLRTHVLTHSDEKPYKCDLCGRSFSLSSYLRNHIQTHSGEKPYTCDICGYSSSRATDLRKHLRTHTGEKPYKCEICGQSYSTNKNLKTHFRTHTGEKPFNCDFCGKRFTTNDSLKMHLRTHTGEKPYKCDDCGKHFRRAHHLKKHMRTHTGEMVYKCYICEKTFSRYEALKDHIPTHTEEEHDLDLCGK